MTRKIIAFLGTASRETSYIYQDKVYVGRVFPEALREFVDFDEMLIFVTRAARKATWPILEELNDDRIYPVDIPSGKNTNEMWEIFSEVLSRVHSSDTVIFDITHGLRLTPFLVFLYAAFLKSAREVTIESLFYGAYELGDPEQGIPAPVIDLSEFIELLDWLTATNRFIEEGNGLELAALLRADAPPGIQRKEDLAVRELGNDLEAMASSIEDISNALRVDRPIEAMQAAFQLKDQIARTKNSISKSSRPFEVLTDQIMTKYGQFSLADPLHADQTILNLTHQLSMIRWYLDHHHIVQAVLLSREWMVSMLTYTFGHGVFIDREIREITEDMLTDASRLLLEKGSAGANEFPDQFGSVPNSLEIVKLWQRLTQVRNDIAHCGMRLTSQDAQKLICKASDYYPELCDMYRLLIRLEPK